MSSIKEQIKSQIALLKAEEKRLKDIEKLKARNQAFQMRMTKEYEKNPVSMLIWSWKLTNTAHFITTANELYLNMECRNFTISKLKKRNHPDTYNLLSLEQFHEIAYCMDKPEWIEELTAKYNEINSFIQVNCCICMEDRCETEMAKMCKKVDGKWVDGCECKINMCIGCVKKLEKKCPTCRAQFTNYSWVK